MPQINELKVYSEQDRIKDELLKQLELALYKNGKRPPTPEEFLDPREGWLSKGYIDNLFPFIKEIFLDTTNKNKKYFQIVPYGSTRSGKTELALLYMYYTIIFFHYLNDPALYYGLSPNTELCIFLISFKYEKTKEVYLSKLFKMMQTSKRFKQVKFQDKVKIEQSKVGIDTIIWSKASTSGEVTLDSGLKIMIGNNDALSFIGSNVLQAYISEIGFFIEHAGATEEDIYRLYTDIYGRIRATVGNQYLSHIFLDTSANYRNSLIEKQIIDVISKQEDAYFKWFARWDAMDFTDFDTLRNTQKDFFKNYHNLRKSLIDQNFNEEQIINEMFKQKAIFPVITGNGQIPAKIVDDIRELFGISKDLIQYTPMEVYNEYKQNLIKSIKDIGGRPTSNENKFIQEISLIDDIFNLDGLVNIESGIIIDSKDNPEKLVWNKVNQTFFSYQMNKYQLHRGVGCPHYIGIDAAKSAKGDVFGFCMFHYERDFINNKTYRIIDMNFAFLPGENGINLQAVENFIIDLVELGNVWVKEIFLDSAISDTYKQNLNRYGIKTTGQSISGVSSLEPHQFLLTLLFNRELKAGRNIFLRNNLQCIEYKRNDKGREIIDHPLGTKNNKYFGDWETSTVGFYGNDVSDALLQAIWGAKQYENDAYVDFNKEQKRFNKEINQEEELKLNLNSIYNKFNKGAMLKVQSLNQKKQITNI